MNVYCERNCRSKMKDGKCNRPDIHITSNGGCGQFFKAPEFEPFREDNVVVFDKAGMPSIMVKFTRNSNAAKVHPMFIIGNDVYDEIFISKYKNCIYNGLAYSWPGQKAKTNITLEEAEKACRDKGEGWHLLTAMERGYLANICHESNIFPHGNTNNGKWHGDSNEKGDCYDGCKTLTGTGPDTWYHDQTVFGVDGLCGDTWEWFRGMRLIDGKLQITSNNDAAMMELDLSVDGSGWIPAEAGDECIYMTAEDGIVKFTTEEPDGGYEGCHWEEVEYDFEITKTLRNLGLFCGEPKAYIYVDTEGERLPLCGGGWGNGASAGVFSVYLDNPRSNSYSNLGFRSAYYRKLDTDTTDRRLVSRPGEEDKENE